METSQKFLDPRSIAKLQGLKLRARHVVEGYVSGVHRSPFHGFSVEFAEHREYSPGDDPRYVDWKVFGRTDKYYVKQFEEETNLVCYLLLDVSESMRFQSPAVPLSKLEYGQCLAAAIAYLVLHQQDSAALATFDNQTRAVVRPGGAPSHWSRLLHAMEQARAEQKTNCGPIFHDLAERWRKRGVVILISDLLDDPSSLLAGLKHFRHRRHEVIVFHLLDPAEIDFPYQRATLFEGLEAGPRILADASGLREAYLRELNRFLREIRGGCRREHIDYVPVRTDQPFDVALAAYLGSRARRAS